MAGAEAERAVAAEAAHPEAQAPERRYYVGAVHQTLMMDFLVAPIEAVVANLAKTGDLSGQQPAGLVFLAGHEYRPVPPFEECPARLGAWDATRHDHVEEKEAAWRQGVVNTAEKTAKLGLRIPVVKEVADAFAGGGNRHAGC